MPRPRSRDGDAVEFLRGGREPRTRSKCAREEDAGGLARPPRLARRARARASARKRDIFYLTEISVRCGSDAVRCSGDFSRLRVERGARRARGFRCD
eukprot:31260-Pelagococcus_subviridis.AAC.32